MKNPKRLKPKAASPVNTLLRVLLFCCLCAGILVIGSGLLKGWNSPYADLWLGAIAVMASFLLTVVFAKWEGYSLLQLGVVPKRGTLRRVLFGFLIGLCMASLHLALVMAFGHVSLERSSPPLSQIALSLLLYLVLASREEIAFRGYPLRSLSYRIGAWKAQLIVAFIFALEHVAGGFTLQQAFLGAGVGAVLFGLAALITKGIALPIGLHAAWNFGQWAFGLKNMPGIWQVSIDKGYQDGLELVIIITYLIVMSLAIAVFYRYRKTSLKSHEDPRD